MMRLVNRIVFSLSIALLCWLSASCTQRLTLGKLISETDLSRLSYGKTTYKDALDIWGSPDSIILKDGYLLATWKGAGIESIGIALNGTNSLVGTTAEGSYRNMTLIFESRNRTYVKYIIDTDPINKNDWITIKDKYL